MVTSRSVADSDRRNFFRDSNFSPHLLLFNEDACVTAYSKAMQNPGNHIFIDFPVRVILSLEGRKRPEPF